jgi:hypothetical protein
MAARVSVLTPAYGQAAFLGRAVASLLAQTLTNWELVVVDDGSPDATAAAVAPFQADPRVRLLRLPANRGLGAALNAGLEASGAPLVAYLPADDRWDPWHLEALCSLAAAGTVLAWSGCRHHGDLVSLGPPEGFGLQLVQVLHRRTGDRWVERAELESDDLDRLFWAALRWRGPAAGTGVVSCEWVDHPGQRHKAIRESLDGGLNVFRRRYRVPDPLRFHSSDSGTVDEVALYRRFRERPGTPPADDGLKILLVGELAYNPERVLALEERGHRLFGLWTPDGLGASTVGPLPFGHVTDLPDGDWAGAVRRLRPDVIYALLNWRAVPFAHAVLSARLGVPFVWHFKESPFRCIARGTWPQLVDLVSGADAAVLSCRSGTGSCTPSPSAAPSGWTRPWSPPWPEPGSTCTCTARSGRPVPRATGRAGSGRPGRWPRTTSTSTRTWARTAGWRCCRATTLAGCTTFAAPTTATWPGPPGTTSTTRPASRPWSPPGCRCCSRPASAVSWPPRSWSDGSGSACSTRTWTIWPSSSATRRPWPAAGPPPGPCATSSPSTTMPTG